MTSTRDVESTTTEPATAEPVTADEVTVGTVLRDALHGHGRALAVTSSLLVLGAALTLAEPWIVSRFIAAVIRGAENDTLLRLVVLLLVVAIAGRVVVALAGYTAEGVAWDGGNAMRVRLTRHVLGLDFGFHNRHPPGELVDRVDGDVVKVGRLASTMVLIFTNTLVVVGIMIGLLVVDLRVGAAVCVFLVSMYWLMLKVKDVGATHWQQSQEHGSRYYGFLGEAVGATEDLYTLGGRGYVVTRLVGRLRAWVPIAMRAEGWSSTIWLVAALMSSGASVLAYGLSGLWFRQGSLDLAEVYLIVTLSSMLVIPTEQIRSQMGEYQQSIASLCRVRDLLRVTARQETGRAELPSGPLEVTFDRVTFRYADLADDDLGHELADDAEAPLFGDVAPTPGSEDTTDGESTSERVDDGAGVYDVSLTVPAGRSLGLVGPSGAGKSTLARLVPRLFDPAEGRVLIDDVDVRSVARDSVHARVAVVSQQVQILPASLRDNLTMFGDRDDARLLEVLDDLGLGPWLSRQPDGLDTQLSARNLSGGEAQLVSLARVFLLDPGVVVLDEPSSRLDQGAEQRVREGLRRLLDGRTAIVIAHRVETLREMDRVAVLEKGRVVRIGTPEDVLEDHLVRFDLSVEGGITA